jgi:hypothetical protein
VGGAPTHLPKVFPKCRGFHSCGLELAFLAQFYRLDSLPFLKGILCLQLYQCPQVDNGGDPLPIVISVPRGAALNKKQQGVIAPTVVPHSIECNARDDPAEIDIDNPSYEQYIQSKIGGTPFHSDLVEEGEQFILQLQEEPANFNFGGETLLVVKTAARKLETRFG